MLRALMAILCAGLIWSAPATASDVIIGRAKATDGDSLVIAQQRVRLHGIDALEAEQTCRTASGRTRACGGEATRALARLVAGATIQCVRRDTDAYGRIVARCRAGDVDLAAAMVAGGHALAFRRYGEDYAPAERAARAAGLGVWTAGLSFEAPWDWRRARAEPHAAAAARAETRVSACAIKGNVSRAGERVYHLPDGQFWGRTRAEVMFCREAEARAAGYRAARR